MADFVKNCRVTADGQPSGNDLSFSNYFSNANFGKINVPAVLVDRHGHVMTWHLPGILTYARVVFTLHWYVFLWALTDRSQDECNNAVKKLNELLYGSVAKTSSWRQAGFRTTLTDVFQCGNLDFAPGWFMQRREVSIFFGSMIVTSFDRCFSIEVGG